MHKLNSGVVALVLLILFAAFPALNVSVRANTQGLNVVKQTDDFFENSFTFNFIGCERAAWEDIHTAVRAALLRQQLPLASEHDDLLRVHGISKCIDTIMDRRDRISSDLSRNVTGPDDDALKLLRAPTDANAAMLFALRVQADRQKNFDLLTQYDDVVVILSDAQLASDAYSKHADDTRYRDLVNRYNALVDTLANVRLAPGYSVPAKPQELHCESRTDIVGVARTDCH